MNSVCVVPLQFENITVVVIALGGKWRGMNEALDEQKVRLAVLIGNQAASAIYRARLSNQFKQIQIDTVLALAKALEAHDKNTSGHAERITDLAERTAQRLQVPFKEVQCIRWAALLHDIGKIGIPTEVLNKPGPLTEAEWQEVRRHPDLGAEIVLMASNLSHVAYLVRSHHERMDGSGYPCGLRGDKIPFGARILAVVDSYSAMVDGRSYRKGRTHAEAMSELHRCAGTGYDPAVVNAFSSLFE